MNVKVPEKLLPALKVVAAEHASISEHALAVEAMRRGLESWKADLDSKKVTARDLDVSLNTGINL